MAKEHNYAILDLSPSKVYAGLGVYEVMRPPTHSFAARVGLRKQASTSTNNPSWEDYLVGPALDEAERSGEDLHIVWPLSVGGLQHLASENGRQQAVSGINDWVALEALLRYTLFTALGLPARPLGFHVLFAMQPGLPNTTRELLTQFFFESLHLSAFLIADRCVAQLFACGAVSGISLDVLDHTTEISTVHENVVQTIATTRAQIGEKDLDNYLCYLMLQANPNLPAIISPSSTLQGTDLKSALLQIIQSLKNQADIQFSSTLLNLNLTNDPRLQQAENPEAEEEEGITDVAQALATGKADKIIAAAKAAKLGLANPAARILSDPGNCAVPNPLSPAEQIEIGPERHRWAEPLFMPSLLADVPCFDGSGRPMYTGQELLVKSASIAECVWSALRVVDLSIRKGIWENVVVTGNASKVKGVPAALVHSLSEFLIDSASGSDSQAKLIKLVKQPDYFSEFKEKPELSSFLGSSILAKLAFAGADGKSFCSKIDYNTVGPYLISRPLTMDP